MSLLSCIQIALSIIVIITPPPLRAPLFRRQAARDNGRARTHTRMYIHFPFSFSRDRRRAFLFVLCCCRCLFLGFFGDSIGDCGVIYDSRAFFRVNN